jgi:hypothetical protein
MNDSTVLTETKFIISPIAVTLVDVCRVQIIGMNIRIDELDVSVVASEGKPSACTAPSNFFSFTSFPVCPAVSPAYFGTRM